VVFIAVGTAPAEDGSADLSAVYSVAEQVGRNLDGYMVVVTKSTVPVGTGAQITEIIERHQPTRQDFTVVSNPEFLREGSAIDDFLRPDRVVIGTDDPHAEAIMRDIYRRLSQNNTPFLLTTRETAEMIKYAANAFLATKISFINEIANLCELVGADVRDVAFGMGSDQRIGPSFLQPGPGYGGSCLPKETRALRMKGEQHGCQMQVVDAVIKVNEGQSLRIIEKIRSAAGGISREKLSGCRAFRSNLTRTICGTRHRWQSFPPFSVREPSSGPMTRSQPKLLKNSLTMLIMCLQPMMPWTTVTYCWC